MDYVVSQITDHVMPVVNKKNKNANLKARKGLSKRAAAAKKTAVALPDAFGESEEDTVETIKWKEWREKTICISF